MALDFKSAVMIVGTILIAACVYSLNPLTIVAILKTPSVKRSCSNMLLLNLAVTDMVTITVILAFYFELIFGHISNAGCIVEVILLGAVVSVCMLSSSAIAFDRFLFIHKAMTYPSIVTYGLVVKVVVAIWVVSLLVGIIPLLDGKFFEQDVCVDYFTPAHRAMSVLLISAFTILAMGSVALYTTLFFDIRDHNKVLETHAYAHCKAHSHHDQPCKVKSKLGECHFNHGCNHSHSSSDGSSAIDEHHHHHHHHHHDQHHHSNKDSRIPEVIEGNNKEYTNIATITQDSTSLASSLSNVSDSSKSNIMEGKHYDSEKQPTPKTRESCENGKHEKYHSHTRNHDSHSSNQNISSPLGSGSEIEPETSTSTLGVGMRQNSNGSLILAIPTESNNSTSNRETFQASSEGIIKKTHLKKKGGHKKKARYGKCQHFRDLRTIKMLTLMFAIYFVCWMPLMVIKFVYYVLLIPMSDTWMYCAWLIAVTNSIWNFIVYPLRKKDLRQAILRMLSHCICFRHTKMALKWHQNGTDGDGSNKAA